MNSRHLFRKLYALAIPALSCMFGLTGCEDYDKAFDMPVSPFLLVENQTLNFGEGGETYTLELRCNEEYTVETVDGLGNWCGITKLEDGNLKLQIEPNEDKGVRRGRFFIHTRTQADTINVAQLGWGKAILLSQSVFNVAESGNKLSVDITANVSYTFDTGEYAWIEYKPSTRGGHDAVTNKYHFTVRANKEGTRIGEIVVKDTDPDSDIKPVNVSIIQRGLDNYFPGAPEMGEDIKIAVASVTGDGGERSGGKDGKFTYANMIDGDFSSEETARWKCEFSPSVKIPQYIAFTFNKKENLDYIIVYPHNMYNSYFKDVEVYCKSETDGVESDYVKVWEGQLEPSASTKRLDLIESQIDVTKVKFVLKSSSGTLFECREIEFYSRNPLNFDYKTLFKDPACTQLLDGITEDNIMNCPHAFFKNLAWYMYNGKYPREFRIADYKAYPHPDKQAGINKTAPYSLLDNPTGISVTAGEQLAVMADLKGLKDLRIRVQNLDQQGKDGFGGDEYTVVDGVNTFTMKNKGLIYVMYHTDAYETAQPVTLHFTSSKVNGYYDSQNPALKGRWKELLNVSVDTHFDVLGKYVHLTFPTRTFLNYTKNVDDLINLYDDMIYRQQEFLGLDKYGKLFKNRSYFHVIYSDAYMYAANYHTAYIESTLSTLADETKLADNCWGPAHELGHIHQTRPGLKWHGTTEVTNNITAQYVQTTIYGKPSRLQSQAADGFPSRYGKAWTSMIAGKKAHNLEADVFCRLVPFWQLELYFGKALGNTPLQRQDHGGFYPDVYEYVRANDNPSTDGKCQLEFVYNCCLNAKVDLTYFFDKWGFLKPVDVTIGDYTDKKFTITQSEINDLKKRVAGLGYAKPDVALEYITDNTVELYKNKPSITAGTVGREENKFTLNNWSNVAAFEVTDAEGNLVYAIEGEVKTFTMTTDWKSGYKLSAVSATGVRMVTNVK